MLGVVEGFYGPPWSWPERAAMLDFLGRHGFTLYVHAPKDDPFHRARWREPLPYEELTRFESLARRDADVGVEVCYGLSPFDLALGDEDGVEAVIRRAVQVAERGIDSFALLFDDPPQDLPPGPDERTVAAVWQAAVAGRMLDAVRSAGAAGRFLFCPTEYCGDAPEPAPYLRTLGELLEGSVDIFWTGPQVCSRRIAASDLVAVTDALHRPPLIWDNYPVNDGEMRHDPHIRPVRGRAADLPAACRGIVVNGAIEARASRIALHTFAAYWRDPAGYDPEAAWGPALEEAAGDSEDAAALRLLGGLARRSPIEPGEAPPIDWLVPAGDLAGREPGDGARRRRVAAEAEALRLTAERLLASAADGRPVPREMVPWARKLGQWADTILRATDLLTAVAQGAAERDVKPRRDRLAEQLRQTLEDPHRVADGRFETWVRACLQEPGTHEAPQPPSSTAG